MPRFDMFEVSELRIDQKAAGHRKGRAFRFTGKPAETQGAADPHRPVEDSGGKLERAGELAGAAAQDHTGFRLRCKGRIRKPVPDHLKNLLGTVPDNIRDRGA